MYFFIVNLIYFLLLFSGLLRKLALTFRIHFQLFDFNFQLSTFNFQLNTFCHAQNHTSSFGSDWRPTIGK
jgi:hypothetical protein